MSTLVRKKSEASSRLHWIIPCQRRSNQSPSDSVCAFVHIILPELRPLGSWNDLWTEGPCGSKMGVVIAVVCGTVGGEAS